ncbi:putative DNA mismatch repair protein MLH1 [Cocos nucifera]|nr:putative DNA mismatch repair protein MLH1 [Cocos nucifera]
MMALRLRSILYNLIDFGGVGDGVTLNTKAFECVVGAIHGANKADVHTVVACSRLDAIKIVYGVSVACDLMEITTNDNPARSIFKMDGFISNANYAVKKTTMILFINVKKTTMILFINGMRAFIL